jgi:hypothetical protein
MWFESSNSFLGTYATAQVQEGHSWGFQWVRVGLDSDRIILVYYIFLIRFESDSIKFESKNLNLYLIRWVTDRPDPYKIIKYLLIIFI